MTLATIIVTGVCAVYCLGCGIFVLIKRNQMKKKAIKKLKEEENKQENK